jgi:hypothetical protein
MFVIEHAHLLLSDDRMREIYKWIGAPDSRSNHLTAKAKRMSNTGNWFLEGQTPANWQTRPYSVLWLNNIGK